MFGHAEYVDFFTSLSRDDGYLVSAAENDGRLAGMLFLLPCMLKNKEYSALGYYMYSVCVSPELRGRGIFRRMCAYADGVAKAHGGKFVALIPADTKLYETYVRLGYDIPLPGRVPTGEDYDTAQRKDASALFQSDLKRSETEPTFIMTEPAQPFTRKNADMYKDFPLFDKGLMKLIQALEDRSLITNDLPTADNFPE